MRETNFVRDMLLTVKICFDWITNCWNSSLLTHGISLCPLRFSRIIEQNLLQWSKNNVYNYFLSTSYYNWLKQEKYSLNFFKNTNYETLISFSFWTIFFIIIKAQLSCWFAYYLITNWRKARMDLEALNWILLNLKKLYSWTVYS